MCAIVTKSTEKSLFKKWAETKPRLERFCKPALVCPGGLMAKTREGWLQEGRNGHCHLPQPGLLAKKEAYYRCCCSRVFY